MIKGGFFKHYFLVIRPRELGLKTCKSDPVALYHWYQAEWKKVNFPGEDRRSHLRWAIRGQMMGRDVVKKSKKRCWTVLIFVFFAACFCNSIDGYFSKEKTRF